MRNITVILIFSFFLFASCRYAFKDTVKGNGVSKTENRSVSPASNVNVSGNIDLYVKQDSTFSVRIEADENLLKHILTINDDNTLRIKTEDGYELKSSKPIKAYVSAPVFSKLSASGSCDIFSESKIQSAAPVLLSLSGSSDVHMDVKAPKVDAGLSGSGSIELKGETKDFEVSGSGSTDIKCFDLLTENTKVELSGSGNAEVFASVKLEVHVSGSADVKYKGNAAVNPSISGSGTVKKVE
jgi:hypothetical protein